MEACGNSAMSAAERTGGVRTGPVVQGLAQRGGDLRKAGDKDGGIEGEVAMRATTGSAPAS